MPDPSSTPANISIRTKNTLSESVAPRCRLFPSALSGESAKRTSVSDASEGARLSWLSPSPGSLRDPTSPARGEVKRECRAGSYLHRHGRACPGHPHLACSKKERRGCPQQVLA